MKELLPVVPVVEDEHAVQGVHRGRTQRGRLWRRILVVRRRGADDTQRRQRQVSRSADRCQSGGSIERLEGRQARARDQARHAGDLHDWCLGRRVAFSRRAGQHPSHQTVRTSSGCHRRRSASERCLDRTIGSSCSHPASWIGGFYQRTVAWDKMATPIHGARIQTSRSFSVVRITGIGFGWVGSTMAFGVVVRNYRQGAGLRPA
ncbi:hypothetical protein ACVWZZ_002283 [Bradyrhizobium sp. LM6.10]